ncbi:Mucin-associated surface protein (MASP) [Trypanosoma cruzi]|uniref:Mucin-associated surface protein (MASP) n=1 Tax=Trypanosoma cruzi TaxID=5693 RepID=A0A2V2UXX8_TRYCR|nr:Mucin-associated surface protein (MASP) [Trypanosoma cruzi]PWU88999.1 Mucin-associated surface protein (MASP) [Trypanosoma cruzi]
MLPFVTVRGCCVTCLLLLSLCVDVLLVCAEGYTQVTGVMAMIMTGRVLLVCALCVLWCVTPGGVYARDVDTNALGGCMASGVLGENGSHMPDGCNKTAITVPLRSVLPITAVAAANEEVNNTSQHPNNSGSDTKRGSGGGGGGSAAAPAAPPPPAPPPTGGPGASVGAGGSGAGGSSVPGGSIGTSTGDHVTGGVSSGPSDAPGTPPGAPGVDPTAGRSDGEAGSPGSNPSKTTGDSQTGDQTPAAAAAHNSSPPEGPTGKKSGTGHKGQEEEEEEEEDHEKQQQSDEAQVQQHQQHEHPAENGEESAKDKNTLRTNATANTGDSDGSTAASHAASLFCFFFLLLRVRLLLRWWPRESECERAMHRPHTHSSFTHSLCVSPCMDSRPHLTPRGTHNNVPIVYMHAHPCRPLVLSFARHAPLPSCLAAWAEHRNCFCFVFIALSGRPLSLPLCVCFALREQ